MKSTLYDNRSIRQFALDYACKMYENINGKNGVNHNDQNDFFKFVKKIEKYLKKG